MRRMHCNQCKVQNNNSFTIIMNFDRQLCYSHVTVQHSRHSGRSVSFVTEQLHFHYNTASSAGNHFPQKTEGGSAPPLMIISVVRTNRIHCRQSIQLFLLCQLCERMDGQSNGEDQTEPRNSRYPAGSFGCNIGCAHDAGTEEYHAGKD